MRESVSASVFAFVSCARARQGATPAFGGREAAGDGDGGGGEGEVYVVDGYRVRRPVRRELDQGENGVRQERGPSLLDARLQTYSYSNSARQTRRRARRHDASLFC